MKGLVPVDNDRRGRPREHPKALQITHAHTQGNPEGVTWTSVTSGSHGTCTTTIVRKKARKLVAHAQNILQITSGHVTSGSTSQHLHKYHLSCAHILHIWLCARNTMNNRPETRKHVKKKRSNALSENRSLHLVYMCYALSVWEIKIFIAYQNKNHTFNWLKTLHVTFTIPRYRLECW